MLQNKSCWLWSFFVSTRHRKQTTLQQNTQLCRNSFQNKTCPFWIIAGFFSGVPTCTEWFGIVGRYPAGKHLCGMNPGWTTTWSSSASVAWLAFSNFAKKIESLTFLYGQLIYCPFFGSFYWYIYIHIYYMYLLDNLLIIDILEYQKTVAFQQPKRFQESEKPSGGFGDKSPNCHRDQRGYLCGSRAIWRRLGKNRGPKDNLSTEGRTAQKTFKHYSFSAWREHIRRNFIPHISSKYCSETLASHASARYELWNRVLCCRRLFKCLKPVGFKSPSKYHQHEMIILQYLLIPIDQRIRIYTWPDQYHRSYKDKIMHPLKVFSKHLRSLRSIAMAIANLTPRNPDSKEGV